MSKMASLVAQLEKNLPERREILDLIPGLGRSPGEGKGYPLHYSGLENSMDCSPWDSLGKNTGVKKKKKNTGVGSHSFF